MNQTAILVTQSYPYEAAMEDMFIEPELEHLLVHFDRVVMVPTHLAGRKRALPPGVELNEDYARWMGLKSAQSSVWRRYSVALRSSSFWIDTFFRPRAVMHKDGRRRLVEFIVNARETESWFRGFMRQATFANSKILFYTYWMGYQTLGLSWVKRINPHMRLVSRIHGYDFHEERYCPPYLPCRESILRNLDGLFAASDAGRNYILMKYPWMSDRCSVARLGVRDPGDMAGPSKDNVFRIVSCFFTVPVKRPKLLAQGVIGAACSDSMRKFEWHHLGDGELCSSVESWVVANKPANLSVFFHGQLPNEEVMAFYRRCSVDVFVLVSQSEGGCPVAIQEALSFGIPVVASSVGGVPEMVSPDNGLLLSPNPSPAEISEAILSIARSTEKTRSYRANSRSMWESLFNAETNHKAFAERLALLNEHT